MAGTRTGRPTGSGVDDEATLDAVEALRSGEGAPSERAAIIRVAGDEPHVIRRIQRKLADRAKARAGDTRLLLARGFTRGEPRATKLWSCIVDVPVEGGEGWAVTHSVVVGMPVLLVVRNEEPVARAGLPDHPGLRAVDTLPMRHDFDDPSYRLCCEAFGIDPDRGRPPSFLTHLTGVSGLRDRVMAGVPRDPEEAERLDALIDDGLAFEPSNGTYSPSSLAQVHRRHRDGTSERSAQARADAKAAFLKVDWPRSHAGTTSWWLAGPWGYDHQASIFFCGEENDGLSSISSKPEIVMPPGEDDWVGWHAARLTERHCMAIALSPAEMDAFVKGGDRDYWLAIRNSFTKPWARAWAEIARPDLGMTHRIVDAMAANAYAMHLARLEGAALPQDAPLSHELREPIAPSRPRSAWAMVRDALPRALREVLGLRPAIASRGREGLVRTRFGRVVVAVDRDRVLVRTAGTFLYVGRREVEVSVDMLPALDGKCLPLVTEPGFRLADARSGQPLPSEEALPLLREISWMGYGLDVGGDRVAAPWIVPPAWVAWIRILAGLSVAGALCMAL